MTYLIRSLLHICSLTMPVIWSLVHVTNYVMLPATNHQCLLTLEGTWHILSCQ